MTTQLPTNPFPGMNPYLEDPGLWPDVHQSLMVRLRDHLAPRLRPDYRVSIQERMYVLSEPKPNVGGSRDARIPDVAILSAAATAARARASEGLALAEPVVVQLPRMELEKQLHLEIVRVGSREVITAVELLSPTNKSGSVDVSIRPNADKSCTARPIWLKLTCCGPVRRCPCLRLCQPATTGYWSPMLAAPSTSATCTRSASAKPRPTS